MGRLLQWWMAPSRAPVCQLPCFTRVFRVLFSVNRVSFSLHLSTGSGSWDAGDDAQILYTCLNSTSDAAIQARNDYLNITSAEPEPDPGRRLLNGATTPPENGATSLRQLQLANTTNGTLGNYSYDEGNYTERAFGCNFTSNQDHLRSHFLF